MSYLSRQASPGNRAQPSGRRYHRGGNGGLLSDPLFDIDGTLIASGGAGTVAWRQAFDELHGIPADIAEFTDAGMTDPDVGARTFEAVLHRRPPPHELAQLTLEEALPLT